MRKPISIKTLGVYALLICCAFTLVINIRFVKASNTIYIRSDGSIDPSSAPISRNDSIYYFTDNINESIVVEKSNIVVDGYGHTLQGFGEGAGFVIASFELYNVTIRNTNIRGFGTGIILNLTSSAVVSDNNVTNNYYGIVADVSTYCLIFRNYISNNEYGAYVTSSSDNTFYHNSFVNNTLAQVSITGESSTNLWDNGYPLGGNYWSDYGGTDEYRGPYQNITGSDGIGDTEHVLTEEEADRYPLTGIFGPLTEEGENVTVFPTDHVGLIFAEIILRGLTTAYVPESGPEPPLGFIVEQYYIINTSAIYQGKVTIRIIYDNSGMTIADETPRRLMRVVPIRGDANEDFKVDIFDIVEMASAFGSHKGDPEYKPEYDLDVDGEIAILDLVTAAGNYGQRWNAATGWEDITKYVDTENKLIIGETDHLSIYGVTRAD